MRRIRLAAPKRTLEIPWTPDVINIDTGGRYHAFSTLEGDVEVPSGFTPITIAWESFFPGEPRRQLVRGQGGDWTDPDRLVEIIDRWRFAQREAKLTILRSNIIKLPVTIAVFNYRYQGGHGDIYYDIELREAIDLDIRRKRKKKKKKRSDPEDRDEKKGGDRDGGGGGKGSGSNVVTYTVKPGDTLAEIAKRFLGNATRWREIHKDNQPPMGKNPDVLQVGWKLKIRKD